MGFARELFLDHEGLSEEFICTICHDVLEDPLVVDNCEHIYCGACIKDWCDKSGTCPMDREPIRLEQLRAPQRSFLNLVNGLKRKCPFAEQGCTVVIVLGDTRVHVMNCRANPDYKTECEQGCGAKLTRDEVQAHSCIVALKTQLAALRVELSQVKAEAENSKDRLRALEKTMLDRPFDQEMQDWITQMCYDVLMSAPAPSLDRHHPRTQSVDSVWNPFSSLPPRSPFHAGQMLRLRTPPPQMHPWQEQLYLVKYQDMIQERLVNKYGGNWYCQVKPGGSYDFKKPVACSTSTTLEFCILNYEILFRRKVNYGKSEVETSQ